MRVCVILLLLSLGAYGQSSWTAELGGLGSFSSIRTTDLNGDGTMDIVMGAGRLEFQACDSAVIAVDGASGELLWEVSAKDQIFGSAAFLDITGDGVNDVFIGGRSAELMAINGSSGEVIWRFSEEGEWFNFYNPALLADADGDGYDDLLVTNGGDVMVAPQDPDRPPGYIMLISSASGKIIAMTEMPDGRETYMSPALLNEERIVFGTGGETVGGHLYVMRLQDLLEGDNSNAIAIDSSAIKGYVGPPSLADLTGDGAMDIIVNSVDGRLIAIDGKSLEKLWQVVLPSTESYSSPAIGYFTDDRTPDVFVSYGQGVWPELDWSVQVMVNGANGQVEFRDSLGFYQNTTPLAMDLNEDGRDEVVMSLNYQEENQYMQKFFYNTLIAIEFKSGEQVNISPKYEGSNLSSTPWLGDVDGDGFLDILYCHGTSLRHTYDFSGMRVHRISTEIDITGGISWGAYQGKRYDGKFRN